MEIFKAASQPPEPKFHTPPSYSSLTPTVCLKHETPISKCGRKESKKKRSQHEKQLAFIPKMESSDWHMQVRQRGTMEANLAHTLETGLGLNSRSNWAWRCWGHPPRKSITYFLTEWFSRSWKTNKIPATLKKTYCIPEFSEKPPDWGSRYVEFVF